MCGLLYRPSWRLLRPRHAANDFADGPGEISRRANQPSRRKQNTRSATLAVKIARQPKKIALIGAPSSAAAFSPGPEKAPGALRSAGLVERLQSAGFEVTDYGDCAPRQFADDEEHRRARNLTEIVAGLNDLKSRAEIAVKSGALVLVLGGECAQVVGLLTGARRYYKHINLLWFDRDADLNTPATTPSGRIDGMVVAHLIEIGRAHV